MEEKDSNKRKEIIKNWLKDNLNLTLIGIILFAFFFRLYYFYVTKDQALWWDELSYGSIAKTNFLHGSWSAVSNMLLGEISIRPPLLPLIWSVFLKFGASELFSKFFLEFTPSVLSVIFVYLIGKEIYNKKTALIASFILTVSWIHIFYSMRMLTSVPALTFLLISIYYFFKSSQKMETKYFALSIFFLSISVLIRYPFGLVGGVYLVFFLITQKTKFLKKKAFWLGGIVGATPIIIFFLINLILTGSLFPAAEIYATGATEKEAFNFNPIYFQGEALPYGGFIKHILQNPFYIIFLVGLAVTIAQIIIGFDITDKTKRLKFNLFLVLLLFISLAFFIFYIKYSEDRYLLLCTPSLIFLTTNGIVSLSSSIKKYSRGLGIAFIFIILAWGAYSQLKFGDALIENKKTSFYQMKEAFLWLKNNAPRGTVVLGEDVDLYTVYYAEMIPQTWPEGDLEGYKITADYIIINVFHGNSENVQRYLSDIESQLELKSVFFFDDAKTQPAVLIYQYKNSS